MFLPQQRDHLIDHRRRVVCVTEHLGVDGVNTDRIVESVELIRHSFKRFQFFLHGRTLGRAFGDDLAGKKAFQDSRR